MASLEAPATVPGLSAADLARSCSDYLTAHTKRLSGAVAEGQRGLEVARKYAHMFDGLLSSLFCAAEASVRHEGGEFGRLAIVAVGGYGRGTVAPNSDVDVLFVCEDASDPLILQVAERMLYPLWDSGVDIGHALRSVDETLELSESDIRTSTTLLDMRHVAGDPSLMEQLETRGRLRMFEDGLGDFIDALEQDTKSRHKRYGGTLFLREPELKLGRGGLRDLDVITWIARARWAVDCLEDAVEHGALTAAELADVQTAREHLWLVRNRLHLMARRRQDRLTFEQQEEVARQLGYRDGIALGVEQMMQAHYRHARVIARIADCIGERARRSQRDPTTLVDIGGGLSVRDLHIGVDPELLEAEPVTSLRFYRAVVDKQLPPDPAGRDAISAAALDRDWCQRLRRDPEAAALFMSLLVSVDPVPVRGESLMEEFHELGILLAMIPEMEPITGRVPHDAYHSYTADVQSLKSLDQLRALRRGDLASEYLLVSRYAAEMPRVKPLHLALLLNSIGAGHPDDPAKHAAALAGPIGERLGLSAERVQHLQWLITNRETLYHLALRRDLSDPETIAEAAEVVQTTYRLRDLYLLTFCDVSSANPQAMTAWNARMLQDLTSAVANRIDNGPSVQQQVELLKHEALTSVDDADERARLLEFISEMPERYLLANTVEGMRFHAAAAASGEPPVVAATPSGVGVGTLEVLVTLPEQPGILEKMTAALAASSFTVDSAQIYQRSRGDGRLDAFSLFHVGHPSLGDGIDLDAEVAVVRDKLGQLLAGELTTESLIGPLLATPSWVRRGPKVKTEVHVDNGASSQWTVVDVYTRDRVALLHVISSVLHRAGLSIALAKINTEGNRVADVFYVEQIGGGKISGEGQLAKLSKDLRRAIIALDKK